MKQIIIIIFLSCPFINLHGQINFEKRFSPASHQYGKEIFETNDGGFLIQGTIEKSWKNTYLIRTNSIGDTLWTKTYGNDSIQYLIYDMAKTADGGYLMVGDYQSFHTMPSMDSYIQKIDNHGNLVWSNLFGWTTSQGGYKDHGQFVKLLSNNSIIVEGETKDFYYSLNNYQHGNIGWNSYLAKFDNTTGDFLDVTMICHKIDTSCTSIKYSSFSIETINNNIYWLGIPWYISNHVHGNKTLAVFNSNFDTIFTLRTGLENYHALSKTSDNHLILYADSIITKMDTLGNIIWSLPNSSPSQPYELKELSDGNFISIGGNAIAPVFHTDFSLIDNEDVYLNKYNSTGSLLWSKIFELPANMNKQFGNSVIETSDGGFAFTGFSDQDIWLVKTDSLGNFIMSITEPLFQNPKILIYPNPFSSETTIRINKIENTSLSIYNLKGQRVKHINNLDEHLFKIDREGLPNGIYFVHLLQENKIIAINKLIITD